MCTFVIKDVCHHLSHSCKQLWSEKVVKLFLNWLTDRNKCSIWFWDYHIWHSSSKTGKATYLEQLFVGLSSKFSQSDLLYKSWSIKHLLENLTSRAFMAMIEVKHTTSMWLCDKEAFFKEVSWNFRPTKKAWAEKIGWYIINNRNSFGNKEFCQGMGCDDQFPEAKK